MSDSSTAARRVLAETLANLKAELEAERKDADAALRKRQRARAAMDKLKAEIDGITKALDALGGPPAEDDEEGEE